jgi:hypothetical protein
VQRSNVHSEEGTRVCLQSRDECYQTARYVRDNYAVATRLVSIEVRYTKPSERSSALAPGDPLSVSEDVGTMKTALDIMAKLSKQKQARQTLFQKWTR